MKRLIFLLFFCLLAVCVQAQQSLTGKVVDNESGVPIPGVSVFLDGTSYGTETDGEGGFSIRVPQGSRANIIFSHLSYNITALPYPYKVPDGGIRMRQRKQAIGEVTVKGRARQKRAYDSTRMMNAFRAMFLGGTEGGLSCQILNEEDIILTYDQVAKTLTAKADKPIRFVNKYLGYTVDFTLLDFKADYFEDANDLTQYSAGESSFMGFTMFHDDAPTDPGINKNRLEVFSHSPTYFFRNLVNDIDNLYENTAFRLYNNGQVVWPEDFFIVHDIEGRKLVQIRPEQLYAMREKKLPKGVCASLYFTIGSLENTDPVVDPFAFAAPRPWNVPNIGGTIGGILTAVNDRNWGARKNNQAEYNPMSPKMAALNYESSYDMKHLSQIYFYTDKFFIDEYGNIENPNVVRFSGALGQVKAGDMLPDDYRPRLTSDVRKDRKTDKQKGPEEEPEQAEHEKQE